MGSTTAGSGDYFSLSTCPHGNGDGLKLTARFAAVLHGKQVDHLGQPYIYHPARVVRNLCVLAPTAGIELNTDLLAAAWLHDTIEDCGVRSEQLLAWGYSQNCVDMVVAVTKPDADPRPYAQVIDDLIATGNRGAMLLKLADNMDNLHPQRVDHLTARDPEKAARLGARYRDSVARLCSALGLDETFVHGVIQHAPPLTFRPSA